MHINQVLKTQPVITMDDGADLVSALHKDKKRNGIIGSTEETTTGVIRLKAMEKDGYLQFPVVAVNESPTKHMFDNRYGTGQSSIDGIIRSTNILLAGKVFVVVGYGWCGRGVALRAKGMGARVIINETDPVKALEAIMEGFEVLRVCDAAKIADIMITATGNKHVIGKKEIDGMKNGAIIANTGHFNVEIDLDYLNLTSKNKRRIRENLDEYLLKNGKIIYLLGEGRLVNLAAAEGHPAEVMDMSFANQALAVEYLVQNRGKLENRVYVLPDKIDQSIAHLKLKAMGINIDKMTSGQKRYISSWREGT